MKKYWPMAIIKRGREWDTQYTYDAALSYEKAMDVIRIWETHYKMEIIMYRIDANDDEMVFKGTPHVQIELVKELWKDFSDVPINSETECIEDWWGRFIPGPSREEIKHWFEETFHVSVAEI